MRRIEESDRHAHLQYCKGAGALRCNLCENFDAFVQVTALPTVEGRIHAIACLHKADALHCLRHDGLHFRPRQPADAQRLPPPRNPLARVSLCRLHALCLESKSVKELWEKVNA